MIYLNLEELLHIASRTLGEYKVRDYGLLNAISQVPAVRDALHQAAEILKKHLK